MGIINSVLKALEVGDAVRDYKHASRTFVANEYEFHPRLSNLFHIIFTFTPEASRLFSNIDKLEIPILVKSAQLPSFSIDVQTHNQYNRQVHSQHKINYTPVSITFHDDSSDLIRNLWYKYYSFYYDDSLYSGAQNYSTTDRYGTRAATNWGFARGNARFFKDIKIYSMLDKKFSEYTLINPMIQSFNHGQHAYADNATMEHAMGITYETVKYATGRVTSLNPRGFGEIHYDNTPSPLGIFGTGPGNSILGEDGLLSAAGTVLNDLASGNVLGAIGKGAIIFTKTKDANLKDALFKDAQRVIGKILRGENPLSGTVIPTPTNRGPGGIPNVGSPTIIDDLFTVTNNPTSVFSNRSNISNSQFFNNEVGSDVNDVSIENIRVQQVPTNRASAPNKISSVVIDERSATPFKQKALAIEALKQRASNINQRINNIDNGVTAGTASQRAALAREFSSIQERVFLETGKDI